MSKMASKTEVLRHKIAREVFGEVDDGDGIREYPSWEIFEKCLKQHKQIQDLEHRLSNCIESKFKIGQIVYSYNKYQNCVYSLDIISIHIEKYENPIFSSLVYRAKRLKDSFIYGYLEDELFATEEEAKAKLREIQDGN